MSEFIMCCERCGFRTDEWGSKCDELEAKLEAMRTSVKELGSTETAVSANLNAAFATVRRHTRSMRHLIYFIVLCASSRQHLRRETHLWSVAKIRFLDLTC